MILLLFGGTDFKQNSQLDFLVANTVLFSEKSLYEAQLGLQLMSSCFCLPND